MYYNYVGTAVYFGLIVTSKEVNWHEIFQPKSFILHHKKAKEKKRKKKENENGSLSSTFITFYDNNIYLYDILYYCTTNTDNCKVLDIFFFSRSLQLRESVYCRNAACWIHLAMS